MERERSMKPFVLLTISLLALGTLCSPQGFAQRPARAGSRPPASAGGSRRAAPVRPIVAPSGAGTRATGVRPTYTPAGATLRTGATAARRTTSFGTTAGRGLALPTDEAPGGARYASGGGSGGADGVARRGMRRWNRV